MPSSKDYHAFIMEQLSGADGIASRAMMGEYVLYCRGRVFGGIYDDRLLVKITPSALEKMPHAHKELPYEGGSEMLLVEDVDDPAFLTELAEAVADDLPKPRIKQKKV